MVSCVEFGVLLSDDLDLTDQGIDGVVGLGEFGFEFLYFLVFAFNL